MARFMSAVLLLLAIPVAAEDAPKERVFQLTYHGQITGLKPGATARIWIPVPPSNDLQKVTELARDLGARAEVGCDGAYGNQILFFEHATGDEGTITFKITYHVLRREARSDLKAADTTPMASNELGRFLEPDARVPAGGKTMALMQGRPTPADQLQLGRLLYDLVNAHMTYAKDTPGWGRGDAEWACSARRGNCSDFHSLFISLARGNHLPAKFEIGFPVPEQRGSGRIPGYHCWAWFKPAGHLWIPVDISEANKDKSKADYYFGNLTENRVMFSSGRDLVLAPKQSGAPINFFIYPYAEVAGKPCADEQIHCWCEYQDVHADTHANQSATR